MERPRVVMRGGASADGKVTLPREQILMREPSGRLWRETEPAAADPLHESFLEIVRRQYGCNSTLEGSGSLVDEDEEPSPLPPYHGDPAELYQHFLPADILEQPSPPHMWFTTVDGRGRVRWVEEHPDWDVLVLACRSTPADYLAYLREKRICYLIAGDDRVDLTEALSAMAARVGIRCVLSTAGGGLNGALLRAGLIDELSLTIAPALVGGLGTPSVLDGAPLAIGERPTPLRLLSVHTDASGSVRLHYEVVHPG
ncbi:MAG TPA: dihydrofolate reductase family protein [Mycobacteriales bacterium]|nr:dihydrofolate reductase family protein [Mycobacteriales bacterium]